MDINDLFESGTSGKAGEDAAARARSIAIGSNWWCSRVKAWVNLDECVGRYAEARGAGSCYSPCLECATVACHLRALGQRTPVVYVPEEQPVTQEETIMTKPAKKGTPDPVQQEAKLEKEKPVDCTNPFAGWNKYDPYDRHRQGRDSFVTLTKSGSFFFSVEAVKNFGLGAFMSVDLYHGQGKLGLHVHENDSGRLRIIKKHKRQDAKSVNISAVGAIKSFGLEKYQGRRFPLREVGPGLIEIDFSKEVKAA